MRRRRLVSTVVFTDLSLNALLSFLVLFILAFLRMNPEAERAPAIQTEGKFMVVLRWPDESIDDVDLYVMDPLGNIAYFRDRDVGLMHLDHDDLGKRSDSVATGQGDVSVQHNEERTVIRASVPGEYVVNVHMYRKESDEATPVTVTLYRLQGRDAEVTKEERVLRRNGDEATAFRFTLAADDSVSGINRLTRRFVGVTAPPPDPADNPPLPRRERHELP